MEAGMNYFDSWDDWDTDWGGSGGSNGGENTGGFDSGNDWNTSTSSNARPKPSGNDWGTRPPAGGGPSGSGGYNTGEKDVYIIRGIAENPLRGMGGFAKMFRGIPMSANNQINLSLMQSGSVGHGGGALNGVIFGKIEYQALGPGMKVRVQGKNKGGKFVIQKMWDVDSGNMPININHYWKDPLDNGRQASANPFAVKAALIFIVIALAALVLFVKGGFTPATLDKIILVIAIIAVLAFIKIFNINIFNNPFVQKVLLFVGLVAVALFVPGGDMIMTCAIMLFALYLLLKSIIK